MAPGRVIAGAGGTPRRVLHCLRAPIGGLFRHVVDLSREQAAGGMQVGIVCDSTSGGERARDALAALSSSCTLGVHRLPIGRLPALSDAKVLARTARLVREYGCDVVHGHGAKGGAYARLAAHRSGAAAVYTPHGGSMHFELTTPHGFAFISLERWLRPRTNGFVFESAFARDAFRRKVGSVQAPDAVVHNGLRPTEGAMVDTSQAEFDFVFIGEWRKLKGLVLLMQALRSLLDEGRTGLRVMLVGAGPAEGWLRRRVAELGLAGMVTLRGPVHPARSVFAQARCLLMPSMAESFPYIALEATGAGMPIIATRVGGMPEMFGEFAGDLIDAGNSQALASAMRAFLADPGGAADRAVALRSMVTARFKLPVMVREIGGLYGAAIAHRLSCSS